MTKDETYSLLRMVCTALNVKLSGTDMAATVEVWHELFEQFPADVMRAARLRVLADHPYNTLPAPAKFIQAIHAMQSAGEPDALTAWHEVLKAIELHGYVDERGALAAMSPRAAWVAERMGWQSLCMTDADAASIIRAQFVKQYDASRERVPDCRALTARTDAPTALEARDTLRAIESRLQESAQTKAEEVMPPN